MKAVLLSIQPQWCELIASGKKTMEVRKSAPKEVPFKGYIYQTKKRCIYKLLPWLKERQAKVIGEFICDKVDEYEANERGWYIYPQDDICLWTDEMAGYGKGKTLYGWHISDLKIYDKPKELRDFGKKIDRFERYSDELGMCSYECGECKYFDYPDNPMYEAGECCANRLNNGVCPLTSPPQSWQFVEELC